nr:MAG TPA: hypothetical protein [Caudoviricetes sp.]
MRGITNAVVYSGGEGSGDVIYAVNQTGEEVVAANKQVYLVRQMNFETKLWAVSGYNILPSNSTFFMDNNLVRYKDVFSYNENTDNWDKTTFSNIIIPDEPIIDIIEGKTVYSSYYIRSGDYLSCSICDLNTQRQFPNSMVWLGDGLALAINPTSANVDIYPYDYETNTVDTTGEPLITLNMPAKQSITKYRVILTDGKILYAHDNVIDVYDRTTYSLIRTVQFPNAFMIYVTGFEPGDYVFGTDSTYYGRFNQDTLMAVNTYKITENYSLETVNDPLFSKMKAQKSGIVYNIETGILQIGFVGEVDAKIYQFDKADKSWTDITPIIDTASIQGSLSSSVPIMAYNKDRTLLAYCYIHANVSTGRVYPYIFKLETTTGEWFAYNPDKKYVIPYQTLTGYTTGKTQDGKIEVATVLPPKVSLTVNVTPDPDTFEFTGAAE